MKDSWLFGDGGRVVLAEWVAFDSRRTPPSRSTFWMHYARGSYQNMSVFGKHFSWLQPGCHLFRLTPQPFDSRQLRDGVYELVVNVSDIAGNHSSGSMRFAVGNAPGVVGV